ncbi:MAG: hypothetical protein HY287_00705 [Planctomycetes bacterium]|nr:hypothetical protein [Planctomycetota bacterium]MBI3832828.1 hypothetical protein [Planctomycetota bacterium]
MKSLTVSFSKFALSLSILAPIFHATPAARGQDADVDAILKMIPADLTVAAVVVNADRFDQNLVAFIKSINPTSDFKGIGVQLKGELGAADWLDFKKPIGLGQASLGGGSKNLLWGRAPGLADKLKTMTTAKEEEGVWHITFDAKDDMYCVIKGDIVVASVGGTREDVQKVLKVERSLADELKGRTDMLKDRDFLFHLNFEPIRAMALGGIQQLAMYAPMMAMMAGQQGGFDPTGATTAITGLVDGVKKFGEQAAYLELVGGITNANADLTVAVGFKDGDIKSYLTKNQPATSLLSDIGEQPFLIAMAWQVPGKESPFIDWFFDKLSAMDAKPATGDAKPVEGAKPDAMKDAVKNKHELYRKLEGASAAVGFSAKGVQVAGTYQSSDAKSALELVKKELADTGLATKGAGGVSFEASGSKKIGDANVDEYTMKFDAKSPQAGLLGKFFSEAGRFYVGVACDRVRYFLGSEADAAKAFAAKVDKPLVASASAADAVKALPAKKNVLLLLDFSGALGMISTMTGAPMALPPGAMPPAAISLTMSGEPARLDLHVPLASLRGAIQAAGAGSK